MMPQVPGVTRRRWWCLGLASFAISLIVLAPAALIELATNRTAGTNARFAADGGTIWRGQGRILIVANAADVADAAAVMIPIAWRFDPLALAGLRLGFFVDANAPALAGTAHIAYGFGGIELRETALAADARLLSMAHSAAAIFAPAGKISLQQTSDERLIVRPAANNDAWRVDGSMGLNTEQLAFGGVVNAPVGSHQLKLRGDGAAINISILRSTGPLKLEGAGTLTLAAPRRFTFSGFATTTADAPASLKQLGPLMADGRQRIELNTTW